MLANGHTASSSESDDEETKRLKEAVYDTNNVQSAAKNLGDTQENISVNSALIKKISKRNNTEVVKNGNNELNTTPEFRSFIAKKLASFIDSTTECIEKQCKEKQKDFSSSDGFRLFSASHGDWLSEEDVEKRSRVQTKRRRKISSSESSDEEVKLAEAVITNDFMADLVKNVSADQHNIDKNHEIKRTLDPEINASVLYNQSDKCSSKKSKKCKNKEKDSEIQSKDAGEKKKHKKKKKHKCDEK